MKRGVVMIMTLALVLLLSLVVLRSTTTTENYLSKMNDAMFNVQFNRTFLDMTDMIKTTTSQIKSADMFAILLKMPIVISDDKSGLGGVLRLNSGAGKININNLLNKDENSTINQTLYEVFESLLRDYQVSDSRFFMSLVLDLIDEDKEQRSYGSELAHVEGASVWDGGITNKKAFEKILNAYMKNTSDFRIYKVPWDKIIRFNGEKIDYNYLNSTIKAILERDYGINTLRSDELIKSDEDLMLSNAQKSILSDLHVQYYVPVLDCNFNFSYLNNNMSIDFVYDLEKRRISNIETIF